MSTKATKVPVMRKSQLYSDWKKELQIWKVTNSTLDKKMKAGILFESLEGMPRQTVLSELTVDQITDENGVDNIIRTLDKFYIGNETQKAFDAMEDLLQFKCDKDDTVENFIQQFQLKVNKVQAAGTILPDGVLGYTLLSSANLPEDKRSMVKATCDELTFRNVKMQLEKIGFNKTKSTSSKFTTKTEPGVADVKLESCFYGDAYNNQRHYQYHEASGSTSDEDLNGERIFFSENRGKFSTENTASKFKKNPCDRFGNVRSCTFCQCNYHWLIDCPYAPGSVKNNLRSRGTSTYDKTNKVL